MKKIEILKNKKLKIGDIVLKNPFLLAPLAGVTDSSYRRICSEMGASMVYTEMVSAKGLYYKDKKTDTLLRIYDDEKPVAYQIFGSDPNIMSHSAEVLEDRENVLLDVNMGCPVPKIVKNGEGSALLKNPKLVYEILNKMVKSTKKPVTVKIRIGFENDKINGVEIAKIAEEAGVSAIAVHGRTREQYYSGNANWEEIAKIKNSVKIPVIGNGDIFCGKDAIEMINKTGCDFVMIARGAQGNPWIFKEALSMWNGSNDFTRPSIQEIIEIIYKQFDYVIAEKGERAGIREMRKHISWYLKGITGSAKIRDEINRKDTIDEVKILLNKLV